MIRTCQDLLPPHWLDLIKKNQGDAIFTFLPKKILYSSATFLQMILFILENLDQMVRLSNAEFQYLL